jgi:hypothetical protein
VGIDGSGWDADDPEYLLARIGGVVDDMSRRWRGRPAARVEVELRRRLAPLGERWPPELIEFLVRRIRDPRWAWKHPLQAMDLGRRYNARARMLAEGP